MAKYWITKHGQRIAIRKLGDQHLLNIIGMLKKNAQQRRQYALSLIVHNPFGSDTIAFDMAETAFYYEIEKDWEDYVNPLYYDLCLEAKRRGLKEGEFKWHE